MTESTANRPDGHLLSEFIYGVVTGMIALEGLGNGEGKTPLGAIAVVVAGALVIWLAHAYSISIARRVAVAHRLAGRDVWEVLAGSWPIVGAGFILSIPMFLALLGVIKLSLALDAASLIGVAPLALVGALAGAVTNETVGRRILLAALSAGLGIVVVLVEFLVRR